MLLESLHEVINTIQRKRNSANIDANTTCSEAIQNDNLLMEEEKIHLSTKNEQADNKTNLDENTDEFWRFLALDARKRKFYATPPTYNDFRHGKKHWLEANPIPWEIINKSTIKCEKWLNEQCI